MTKDFKPVLFKPDEAAAYLHVSQRWIRRAIYEGRIPIHKLGGLVRIAKTDLDTLLAESRREATR